MEKRRMVADILEPAITGSLEAGNSTELVEAFERAEPNEVLSAMGLRVQLRDLWVKQKNSLARVHEGGLENLSDDLIEMFHKMDDDITNVSGQDKQDDEVAQERHEAFVVELKRLEDQARIAFAANFAKTHLALLDTPDGLVVWTRQWRDTIVERLWSVEQDYREGGVTPELTQRFDTVSEKVNDDLDKLIRGTVNPAG